MNLIQLTEQDKLRYNEFVASNARDAFLQSWEWGDWQEQLGKQVKRVALITNNDIIATAQLIKLPPHRSPMWYAPRGPVMGSDNRQEIFKKFIDLLKPTLGSALGVRVEPEESITGLETLAKQTLPSQPERTMIIDTTQDAEDILKKMHEKTRYNIRLAEKKGVTVTGTKGQDLTDEQIENCVTLLQATAQRQKFRNHSTTYLHTFLNHFRTLPPESAFRISVYFADYEHTLLTAAVMVDFGKTRMYLYGGSSSEHRNVMAPYLLHWRAITDAKKSGLNTYDLGGSETVSGKQAGFTRFKSGFNGTEISYAGTWDISFKPLLYPLYALSRKINRVRIRLSHKSNIIN